MRFAFAGLLVVGIGAMLVYYMRISQTDMLRWAGQISNGAGNGAGKGVASPEKITTTAATTALTGQTATTTAASSSDNSTEPDVSVQLYVDDPADGKIYGGAVNGTLYTLLSGADDDTVLKTVRSMSERFANAGDRHYDWVFVAPGGASDTLKDEIRAAWPGAARFAGVEGDDWTDLPSFLDEGVLRSRIGALSAQSDPHSDDMEYRKANRFHTTVAHIHPVLSEYRYALRVDAGVELLADASTDLLADLAARGAVYGFADAETGSPRAGSGGLWESVRSYVTFHQQRVPQDNLLAFVSNDKGSSYNHCQFSTGLAALDLEFFREETISAFLSWIDREGGYYYELWSDAPVHSIAVSLFAHSREVVHFADLSWRQPDREHCAVDTDASAGCTSPMANATSADTCLRWIVDHNTAVSS